MLSSSAKRLLLRRAESEVTASQNNEHKVDTK